MEVSSSVSTLTSNVFGSSSTAFTTIVIIASLLSKYWLLAIYLMVSVPFQFSSGVYINVLPFKSAVPFWGFSVNKYVNSKSWGSVPVNVICIETSSLVCCEISSTTGAFISRTVIEFSWILVSFPPGPWTFSRTE